MLTLALSAARRQRTRTVDALNHAIVIAIAVTARSVGLTDAIRIQPVRMEQVGLNVQLPYSQEQIHRSRRLSLKGHLES